VTTTLLKQYYNITATILFKARLSLVYKLDHQSYESRIKGQCSINEGLNASPKSIIKTFSSPN